METPSSVSHFRIGLKFGLGFSIPFVFLYALAVALGDLSQKALLDQMMKPTIRKVFGPEAKLEIVNEASTHTRYNFYVRGTIANRGADLWEYVRVEADLLGANNELLKLCSTRVPGVLRPGDERYFEVDCEGSEDEPVPDTPRYEVKIVDGSYRSIDGT